MSEKYQIVRKCKDCPTWTQTVCRHAFGVYWCLKSNGGEGCSRPLDDAVRIWRNDGWTPRNGMSIPKTVRKAPPKKESAVQLDLIPKPEPPPLSDDDY